VFEVGEAVAHYWREGEEEGKDIERFFSFS